MTAAAVTRELIRLLVEAADLAQDTIRPCAERRERDDVLADQSVDDTVVALLVGQGLTVRSEESGTTGPAVSGRHTVLLDPLDGSRNFRLGVPWYAFSACVLTDGRPRIGLVRNLATGETTLGVHGQGAWAGCSPSRAPRPHRWTGPPSSTRAVRRAPCPAMPGAIWAPVPWSCVR